MATRRGVFRIVIVFIDRYTKKYISCSHRNRGCSDRYTKREISCSHREWWASVNFV